MDELTFEKLPNAVSALLQKVDRLEALLLNTIVSTPHQNQDFDDILDISQASDVTKYRPQTIRKMVMAGSIPSFRKNGRRLFRKSELLLWLQEEENHETTQ